MSGLVRRSRTGMAKGRVVYPAGNALAERIASAVAGVSGASVGAATHEFALLLDTTGSMWSEPMRKLREAVKDVKGVRRFVYADDIKEIREGEEIRDGRGNNNEPGAFGFLKAQGIKHIVMVTDGHPDDPDASLAAAKGLKIDIIYIGPPPPPQFLRDLAGMTGGSFDASVRFAEQDGSRQLSAKVKGLLPAGDPPKGPIVL